MGRLGKPTPTQPGGPPVPAGFGGGAAPQQQSPQPQGTWDPNQDISYTPNQDMPWNPQQDLSNQMGQSYPNIGPYGPVLPQLTGQPLPQQTMACGGVVGKPTVVALGERGPEAVIKLAPRMQYQRR